MIDRTPPRIPSADNRYGWHGVAQAPAKKPQETVKKPLRHRAGYVVMVQSLACVAVLLLALLLRGAGGDAYNRLAAGFRDALLRNELLAAIATLWDGDPGEAVSSALEEENENADSLTQSSSTEQQTSALAGTDGDGGRLPPAGTMAVPLRVSQPAHPPLSEGKLTSGYGFRPNPTGEGEQFHRGVDVAAPLGTPIAAMFTGRIVQVGESASLGHYVRLEHGAGVTVVYGHCSAIAATEGAMVRSGETVAFVGDSGDTTGPHVHIQVSVDNTVYGPQAVIGEERYA